ncbi:MAG: glycosyltransferase family 2 protein [Bacteroidaceae bacterium]|nr:glycosyltransferase family 2 protein [Bacteroidaceae bacterium]MBP9637603.1 glycosyltransferase family 2 protein [Bacteroidaceae bacterium]
MENAPLVSIVVITYNSSESVIETLESAKKQSYTNLELIVTDDCSSDDTVELCKQWIQENKSRFIRIELITAKKNTGVSSNINRGYRAAQGKWVKVIAGDDILLFDCIESYIDYVKTNPTAKFLFARTEVFGGTPEQNRFFSADVFKYEFFELPTKEQYKHLISKDNCIPASTAFIHRETLLEQFDLFDERIPLLEDLPMWIRATNKGYHLFCIDKNTVKYRLSPNSLSTSASTSSNYNLRYERSVALCYIHYQFKAKLKVNALRALKTYFHHRAVLTDSKSHQLFWETLRWCVIA